MATVDPGLVGPPQVVTARSTNPACPHGEAQRVTTIDGEHAGWLCPDCDAVLPPEWMSYRERSRLLSESHEKDHHGAAFIMILGCPRCADETMARYR